LVALGVAVLLWALFGADTDVLTLRGIGACTAGGAIVGFFSTPFCRSKTLKSAWIAGGVGGLVVHPVAWVLFSVGSWVSVQLSTGDAAGTLWESALAGLLFSLGSLTFGFLLTCPAFMGAAWISRRAIQSTNRPDPE